MKSKPGTEVATNSAVRVLEDRVVARRLLQQLVVVAVLLVPIAICEYGIEPKRRGFFCDDDTLRYPFHRNTVTTLMLALLVGLLPLLIISITEYACLERHTKFGAMYAFQNSRVSMWCMTCLSKFMHFGFGLLLTFDFTEVGKYTIGRLRPHFIAVCQPRLLDGSTCKDERNHHRYILDYWCAAEDYTVEDVRQARLSFPSGHSSLAFYAMLYLVMYLHVKFSGRRLKLLRHLSQFGLLLLAWFTALSRVMDNWHHWSDVFAGLLIGAIFAMLTVRFITTATDAVLSIDSVKLSIPGTNSKTTLQEVITTSSPYTINSINNPNNEQYSTKV